MVKPHSKRRNNVRFFVEQARVQQLIEHEGELLVVSGWIGTHGTDSIPQLQLWQSGQLLSQSDVYFERPDVLASFNSSNGKRGCSNLQCGFAINSVLRNNEPVRLVAVADGRAKKLREWSVERLRNCRQSTSFVRSLRVTADLWISHLYDLLFAPSKHIVRSQSDRKTQQHTDVSRALQALLVTHNLNLEGAPGMLYTMAAALKERGRVAPLVLSPCDGPMRARYHQVGVSTIIASDCRMFHAWQSKRDYIWNLKTVEDILHREQPEVVVANTLLGFLFINCAAKLGIPSVWYIHECYDERELGRKFHPHLQHDFRKAFRNAERVVFCSHAARDASRHFDQQDNFSVIQNRIDVSEIDAYRSSVTREEARLRIGVPRGKKVILTVGTLCENKSQHVLVEAAGRLKQHRDDFCCYLVGFREEADPAYAARTRGLIEAHQLSDVVQLVPATNAVFDYYRAADIFVLTSKVESFCLAVAEAKAFGLPILSTPCAGVSEQLGDEANAFFFREMDSEALTAHLNRLLDEEQQESGANINSLGKPEVLSAHAEMVNAFEQLLLDAVMR